MASHRAAQNTLPSPLTPMGDESSSADPASAAGLRPQVFTTASYSSLPHYPNMFFPSVSASFASASPATPPAPLASSCRCTEYRQALHETRARLALLQQELRTIHEENQQQRVEIDAARTDTAQMQFERNRAISGLERAMERERQSSDELDALRESALRAEKLERDTEALRHKCLRAEQRAVDSENLRVVNEHLNERITALEARLGAAERKANHQTEQEREVAQAREALRASKCECLRLQETLEHTASALAEREREAAALRASASRQQQPPLDLSASLSPVHPPARPQSSLLNEQPIGTQLADSLSARVTALTNENESLRERIRILAEQTTQMTSSNGIHQHTAASTSTSGVQSAELLSTASDENSEAPPHDSFESDSAPTVVLRDMDLNGSVSFVPKANKHRRPSVTKKLAANSVSIQTDTLPDDRTSGNLVGDSDTLQAELETQRNQLSELRQALERIVNERDELRTEISELKETNRDLSDQLTSLDCELSKSTARVATLERLLDQATAVVREVKQTSAEDRERLCRENDSLLTQLQQAIEFKHHLTLELIASKDAQILAARECKPVVPNAHGASAHYQPHANLNLNLNSASAYTTYRRATHNADHQHAASDDGIKRAHSSFCIECSTARPDGSNSRPGGEQQLVPLGVERKHSMGGRPHALGEEAPLRNAKSCAPVLVDGDDATQAPSSASLELSKQCSCAECAADEASRRSRAAGQCRCSTRDTTSFTSSFTGSSFASISNPALSVTPSTFSLTADRHQQASTAAGRPPPAPSSSHYHSSSKTNSTSTSSALVPPASAPLAAEGERRTSNVFAMPTSPVSKSLGVGVSKSSLPDSAFISLSSKTIQRNAEANPPSTASATAYTLETLGATPSRAPPSTPVAPKPMGAKPMLRARSPQIADPFDQMLFWQEVLPELNARAARAEAAPPSAARGKALSKPPSNTSASASSGVTNSLNDSALTSTDSDATISSKKEKEHSSRKRLSFLPNLRRHKSKPSSSTSTSNSTQH